MTKMLSRTTYYVTLLQVYKILVDTIFHYDYIVLPDFFFETNSLGSLLYVFFPSITITLLDLNFFIDPDDFSLGKIFYNVSPNFLNNSCNSMLIIRYILEFCLELIM